MYKLKDFESSTLFRDMLLATRTKPVLLKERVSDISFSKEGTF